MADKTDTKYASRDDGELIRLFREGDEDALGCLCARYFPLCRKLAARYDGVCDTDDLVQEGMLGLLEAARRYDPGRQVPFFPYCRRCMTSKMLSALDAMTAQKRRANVASVPFDDEAHDALTVPAPDDALIENEEIRHRSEQIFSLLSRSEKDALRLYLRGFSYAQIAQRLDTSAKSVDNALQRVRRKLRSVF